MLMPTAVAIQCVEVTTPNMPSISGRVGNGSGLIWLMAIRCFFAFLDGRAAIDHSRSALPTIVRHVLCCDHTPIVASEGLLTAWQATPFISLGVSRRQRSKASGQRGLKGHPEGGLIGFGISP